MEIVNTERIVTIALVIFLGAYILALIIIRKTRKSAFSKLAKCDDSKVYFETLNKYLHTAKTQSDRDMLRLLKLNGMIKFKEWDGIVEVIKSINEPISISRQHILVVCRIVLNLFNLDKIEEAKMLISKISNLDKILMGNDWVMLCKAIDEYFDNNLNSSKNTLEQLLNSYTKDQDYILIIHYYLGMIYLKTGDTKSGKLYLNKVLSYPHDCTILNKAKIIISDISDGEDL